jgi:hypothetical protein
MGYRNAESVMAITPGMAATSYFIKNGRTRRHNQYGLFGRLT